MATVANISQSLLILPDGVEIPLGGEVETADDYAENAGVKSWVADGLATVTVKAAKGGKKAAQVAESAPVVEPVVTDPDLLAQAAELGISTDGLDADALTAAIAAKLSE